MLSAKKKKYRGNIFLALVVGTENCIPDCWDFVHSGYRQVDINNELEMSVLGATQDGSV